MTDQLQSDTLTHEWNRFSPWLTEQGYDPTPPVDPVQVAGYLVSLPERGCELPEVATALKSIRGRHIEVGLPSPTVNRSVLFVCGDLAALQTSGPQVVSMTAEVLETIRLTACCPRRQARTVETLEMARECGLVDIALLQLCYDGFLCWSELMRALRGDVECQQSRYPAAPIRHHSKDTLNVIHPE